MLNHKPRIYRLKGTIGKCGTNNPDDVKAIQKMIIGAGYHLFTGRTIKANGVCDSQTEQAIIWYQRLLTLSPTGLIYPTDSFFIQAIENAYTAGRRVQHTTGSLRTKKRNQDKRSK